VVRSVGFILALSRSIEKLVLSVSSMAPVQMLCGRLGALLVRIQKSEERVLGPDICR